MKDTIDKMKTEISIISNYRSFIMGIAILWVAWFHTDLEISVPGLSFLREVGYGGVDIFFFLSGIGACFSLTRNPDTVAFIKNRAKRILPSYYPFIIVWLVMMKFTAEIYGTEIIGNLTMMGWWSNSRCQFNWYTNAIWLFYLLAPLFVGIICRAENGLKRVAVTLALMLAGFMISMTFWHTLLLTAFSRLLIFALGVYFGAEMLVDIKKGYEQPKEQKYIWQKYPVLFWNASMMAGVVLLAFCLKNMSGYMWNYGLWWYPFVLITPGLCMDLGVFARLLGKCSAGNTVRKVIETAGDASFEIFLWHIGVFEFVKPRFEMNALTWTLLLAVVVAWGILYRRAIQRLFRMK